MPGINIGYTAGRDPELIFYTRQSAAGTVIQKTRVDLPNFYEYLVIAFHSNELYGVKVPGESSLCYTYTISNYICYPIRRHQYVNKAIKRYSTHFVKF